MRKLMTIIMLLAWTSASAAMAQRTYRLPLVADNQQVVTVKQYLPRPIDVIRQLNGQQTWLQKYGAKKPGKGAGVSLVTFPF